MDFTKLTINQLRQGLLDKKFTATQIVQFFLERIKTIDPQIKAFITITDKIALNQAKIIDEKIKNGKEIGKLAGSIMAVKDIFLTKDIETTASSQVLKGYIPKYSSTVYQKLIDQDAICIGKTNTDPFAFGGSTENSGFFTTKNPYDLTRIPGGSSGGSAAALAAGLCTFALGTDTGGSIRLPASLCGVSGLKPTYGLNSRFGITAMASSFDCPGVFANFVQDLAILTNITAGQDLHDATSISNPVPDYQSLLKKTDLKGLKIGLPKEYFTNDINQEVKDSVMTAAKVFEKKGVTLIDVSLPSTNLGIAVYYILVPSEISANMARYDGIRFGQSNTDSSDIISYYMKTRGQFMEPEVKRRIMIGTYALSSGYYDAYYTKAAKVRTLIKKEFTDVLSKVDVILAPVSSTTAWRVGEKVNDPLKMYLVDAYTVCVNVAGIPSVALPCGLDSQNLPIGFQLIGNFFEESKILSIAHQYQQVTDFHFQKPKL
ncbi:MAG: Asp-tRNA(Asn)/Glu-tRNA(Gln) amidotransferase subunit GatA [Candidatus Shapirobacteria bacterium]|nr:Asp-tRNA(Asn)/Glu-tRNA(Gln) amidotransferase subunit GatA [Candidatus Shapirobacteria bacterium]